MTKLEIKGDINIVKGKSEELLGRIQKYTSETRDAIERAVK
jgi:hypothetical protein